MLFLKTSQQSDATIKPIGFTHVGIVYNAWRDRKNCFFEISPKQNCFIYESERKEVSTLNVESAQQTFN